MPDASWSTHVYCRDIRCSSVCGPPYSLIHGSHNSRFDIFEHSNSLLSSDSTKLSPYDQRSTSPADTDCASAFPASNAHETLPNTSNHSMIPSGTEISPVVHGTTDHRSSRSPYESPETSEYSHNQASGTRVTGPSPCSSSVVKEAPTRARSPAVEVAGLQPLQKAPRGNSVKQYHRLDSGTGLGQREACVNCEFSFSSCFTASLFLVSHRLDSLHGVVFYQKLEVTDEYGKRHSFDLRNRMQGALVSALYAGITHKIVKSTDERMEATHLQSGCCKG